MTRTRVTHRHRGPGWMAARLLVLAGALAGLFAMHGLADHGASSHGMPTVPLSAAAMSMDHAGHASETAPILLGNAGRPGGEPAGHGPGMGEAGLCLAILAGAVIGFALLRRHRRLVLTRPHKRLWFASAPLAALRDRDPPCLFELSALRT